MKNGISLPETVLELQGFVKNKIQENVHLDYKRSQALSKKARDEIIKDVTAFANSDGGILIYGIEEVGNLPEKLDVGVDDSLIDREWIERILSSNIVPFLDGIKIIQIPFLNNRSFYAIEVPKSFRGPHQANDKKYYKRHNFESSPMDHYEILDVTNRKSFLPIVITASINLINGNFYLTIENTSSYSVRDVNFIFPESFKWPNSLFPKALKNGIKFFPANKKFNYFFSNYSRDSWKIDHFELTISYIHPELNESKTEYFYINFADHYEGEIRPQDNQELQRLQNAIHTGFSDLNNSIKSLIKNLK